MLVVEPVHPEDAAGVAKFAHDTLRDAFGDAWIHHHLQGGKAMCLVAREARDNHIMGFVIAERDAPCEAHLLALAVRKHERGMGVGGALLKSLEDRMAREGAFRLRLEVRADDLGAQAFYHRHGFRPEGLEEAAYRDGQGAIHMTRPLR